MRDKNKKTIFFNKIIKNLKITHIYFFFIYAHLNNKKIKKKEKNEKYII